MAADHIVPDSPGLRNHQPIPSNKNPKPEKINNRNRNRSNEKEEAGVERSLTEWYCPILLMGTMSPGLYAEETTRRRRKEEEKRMAEGVAAELAIFRRRGRPAPARRVGEEDGATD